MFLSRMNPTIAVIERFEELEGRKPGQTSAADLPNVLNLRKELCEAHVLYGFSIESLH